MSDGEFVESLLFQCTHTRSCQMESLLVEEHEYEVQESKVQLNSPLGHGGQSSNAAMLRARSKGNRCTHYLACNHIHLQQTSTKQSTRLLVLPCTACVKNAATVRTTAFPRPHVPHKTSCTDSDKSGVISKRTTHLSSLFVEHIDR